MALRCKQGDLAVVVRAVLPENLGKFVTCVRFISEASVRGPSGRMITYRDAWEIEPSSPFALGPGQGPCRTWVAPDSALRPIRDGEGADETIAWAGWPADLLTRKEPA